MLTRGMIGSLLVLAGGMVVSPLPRSARVLHLDPLLLLRGSTAGRMLGLAVVLVGLGMLAAAWIRLCRHAAGAGAGEQAEALGLVRQATVVWALPLLIAPPLFSRDGWSYAAQGMLTTLDMSPYEHGPGVLRGPISQAVDPQWMNTPTPYGPLPLILGDIAARLTADPWVLVIAHRCVAMIGLVLLAWALPRLARWNGVNPALASGLVLASPLMVSNGVGGLHNDLLMVGLMAAALVVAEERGWPWAAALGGAAAAVKLPGGLICIAVALVSLPLAATLAQRVRRLVAVGVVAIGTLWGLGAIWGLGTGWLAALAVPGTVNTPLSAPTVLGGVVDLIARGLGAGAPEAFFLEWTRALATVAALVVAGWVALRWRTGDRSTGIAATVFIVSASLLLSPVVHLWYFLWLVPFLAVHRLGRSGTVFLIALSVVAGLVAPLDSSLHGAYLIIVVGSTCAAALGGIVLLTTRARSRIAHIAQPAD
ncbi:polyprenol phosphomannose-dependent alpha 1,6 mannosyltransferase MptB [Nocardioides sp. AE5]|uniref:polyprenol phosphomannose-dependent alpha 1,6 mannosyltransferase MptB n=1 Tax=Nocardioides sp. AE5 TaxID=2962573 RepID=UPI002881846F|nr:polyprenol phosphomannose-dependent alpha 1,6 mannosyltransferase MptB [Nocardioides sp. AE5]MDT0200860.1 polyprenol phosphomannose-dependent alpha 1,6 mannosyltransferase MptB [Nocardioides sp. AE5]